MSVKMIDISSKEPVSREASATGAIRLRKSTIDRILSEGLEKGDVFAVARVAAIQAVKGTPQLIPLCHPIPIEQISVDLEVSPPLVRVTVRVKAQAKTGVEMEALAGVCAALLTVWDMTKKYEKDDTGQYPTTAIEGIRVLEKLKGTRG